MCSCRSFTLLPVIFRDTNIPHFIVFSKMLLFLKILFLSSLDTQCGAHNPEIKSWVSYQRASQAPLLFSFFKVNLFQGLGAWPHDPEIKEAHAVPAEPARRRSTVYRWWHSGYLQFLVTTNVRKCWHEHSWTCRSLGERMHTFLLGKCLDVESWGHEPHVCSVLADRANFLKWWDQ